MVFHHATSQALPTRLHVAGRCWLVACRGRKRTTKAEVPSSPDCVCQRGVLVSFQTTYAIKVQLQRFMGAAICNGASPGELASGYKLVNRRPILGAAVMRIVA